jgi:FAD/FMN-containing dehydrogenase
VNFTVRSGGNDFYGRFVVDDGLIIDVRELKDVSISADKRTATLGGGIVGRDLASQLEDSGYICPVGNAGSIGYVGWVTLGGYGPLTNALGMGCEGIVGAEVVNAKGEVVQADEEMLEGIRGMGGNLGVITKLTIRIYPKFEVSRDRLFRSPYNKYGIY